MANKRTRASSESRQKSQRPKKKPKKAEEIPTPITYQQRQLEDDDDDVLSDGDEAAGNDLASAVGPDPFSEHFEAEIPSDGNLLDEDKQGDPNLWSSLPVLLPHLGKGEFFHAKEFNPKFPEFKESDLNKMHVRKSLVNHLASTNIWNTSREDELPSQLSKLQLELFTVMNSYQDLYFAQRTHKNGEEIRLTYCLHALNHVLKTRSRVVSHNKLLESKKDEFNDAFRDQGLTRPKVLIVLPFRDSALKVVNLMSKLLSERQRHVESRNRFEQEYGCDAETKKGNKPDDFEVTFDGNIDDQFRIGMSISKKALKLYSDFYSSDIILASPLGLWTIIGAENEKERDFDFLSSIEVLIFDQMDVFFMQNFENVTHLLSRLHCTPKETHDVDYFRVRMWTLNGWSKLYRQTLMFSGVTHPMLENVFRKHCFNYSGKLKIFSRPSESTIASVHVTNPLPQIFHRINVENLKETPDVRFNFFLKQILPHYTDGGITAQTLVFISSYFDFVRLRNHFAREEQKGTSLKFSVLSEYSKKKTVSRSRQFFLEGKTRFMLFTERFHFFRRYKLKGIQHVIFYDLPIYPHFYPEICSMIGAKEDSSKMDRFNQLCTVLYTKYDMDRLVPVVGFDKATELLASNKNVHTFHSV